MKQPIAMKCTKKQFKAIKPKLLEISEIGMLLGAFKEYKYLTNNYRSGDKKIFDFIGKSSLWENEHKNNIHEEWNEKIFLEACGIETEKKFSITESQIKTLYDIFEVSEAYQGQDYLKELFPESEAFESKVKELKVGVWYKHEHEKEFITFVKEDERRYGVGINREWFQDAPKVNDPTAYYEATEQEVFEALKNEAVKRGFVQGNFIKNNGLHSSCKKNELVKNPEFDFQDGGLWIDNCGESAYSCLIFEKGKWAEIIPTITLSEAEQQLKKKIIV